MSKAPEVKWHDPVHVRPNDVVTVPFHLVDGDGKAIRADYIEADCIIPPHMELARVAVVSRSKQSYSTHDGGDRHEFAKTVVLVGDSGRDDGHQFSLRLRAAHAGRMQLFRFRYVSYRVNGEMEAVSNAGLPTGIQFICESNPNARVQLGDVRVIE